MAIEITRRKMLGTTAAAAALASAGTLPAFAGTIKTKPGAAACSTGCAAQHDALAQNLARLAKTGPAHGPYGLDYALKTTVCPHCSTRIGLDPMTI